MKDKSNITFEDLYKNVCTYIENKDELNMIEQSYQFAYEAHKNQKRLDKTDYIKHPLNVAYILSEIGADYQTICAGLLHDTMDKSHVTKDQLRELFGTEIAQLVYGITRINRLNYNGDNEKTIANHRKILVGLTEDVRVIIIKMADRLHNMRTMSILDKEKQKENAKETLEILIPIAHRLGMSRIKTELEELSLRYLKPDVYFSIVERLNKSKNERNQYVENMMNEVSKILNEHGIKHEIKGRAKSIYSIYKKLDKGKRFKDIYDLLALRVYVETEGECYQVMGLIHSKFRPVPGRLKDYIAMPKSNMYQSLHTTVFGADGNCFEIQIRTYQMDKVAEHGIASHWSYKENGKTMMQDTMEEKLQFFRNIMEIKENDGDNESFVKDVKEDILNNTIYVYTPKGDVVELPKGATPIDFAYRVHTKVGHTMVGAIVNERIVPLDYKLQNNDIIRINTNKNQAGPSLSWLDIVYTSSAKNKIKAYFNKIDKEEYLKKGEELLTNELRKKKIPLNDFLSNDHLDKIYKELKIDNTNDLYIGLGNNKYSPNQIINIIANNSPKKELLINDARNNNLEETFKGDIVASGIDDIKVSISKCCRPIPGDEIIGYISSGNGINIHRIICPNVKDLDERFIDVSWNNNITKKYSTNILVHTIDNKDMLFNIVSKTSNSNIIVKSINTINGDDEYIFDVKVSVDNVNDLNKFMVDLKNISNVTNVERLIK